MKRLVLLVVASLFVSGSALEAQVCVYGTVFAQGASSTGYASNFNMKWCKADGSLRPMLNMCVAGTLSSTGFYNIDLTALGTGYYYPYVWGGNYTWGSMDYPLTYAISMAYTGFCNQVGSLYTRPRAFEPTAINPALGSVNVGTSFTLQWDDGLDNQRRTSAWPVGYDIYASGNEFPETLIFSDIPCGGVGTCSVGISGISYTTRWQWRVVARLHSAELVSNAGSDNSYTTSSGTFNFSTTWDPSIPLHTIQTYGGNYLRAPGGGGSSFDAAGSGNNYETQFQIVDTNGGTLYSGDTVNFRTNRNYYASANYGGGYGVDAIQKWSNSYETWTIVRIAGSGPINPGDQVAFVSLNGYYMTAEGGGGGTVNANRTAIGPWETFTFN